MTIHLDPRKLSHALLYEQIAVVDQAVVFAKVDHQLLQRVLACRDKRSVWKADPLAVVFYMRGKSIAEGLKLREHHHVDTLPAAKLHLTYRQKFEATHEINMAKVFSSESSVELVLDLNV